MKNNVLWCVLALLLFSAASAWGQAGANSGVIAGEVDDSSGGKIAGAKIEVTSPALIESRSTVTGDDGLYRVVNLPPGVYSVTATQNGFNSLRRESVEITTGFTATVNFSLTAGSVTQTVTVSGDVPVLDTQDSVVQKVISSAVIEALPIGKSAADYPALLPGAVASAANQDVGGLQGEQAQGFRIHGSATNDFAELRDGMYWGTMHSGGTNQMSSNNPTATQELQLETSGYSADDWNLGGHVNILPKNGGNDLHGTFQSDFGSKGLESGNVTPALEGLGVTTSSTIRSLYEVAGGVGGPIVKDKLWFYVDARHWVSASNQAGAIGYYFDANEGAAFPSNLYYAQNYGQPAYINNTYTDVGVRLTWQATKRNQFTENFIQEKNCNCYYTVNSGLLAPEAATSHYYMPNWREQATWTFPVNNKLVLWAGFTSVAGNINERVSGGLPTSIAVGDSSQNYAYGAPGGVGTSASYGTVGFSNTNENFTASYVTGAHAFKFGYSDLQARGFQVNTYANELGGNGFPYGVTVQMECQTITTTGGAVYPTGSLDAAGLPTTSYLINGKGQSLAAPAIPATTLNGLPCKSTPSATAALLPYQLTEFLAPYQYKNSEETHSLFGQDQWRLKRLTVNLGLRLDWFVASDPAQTQPAQPQYGLPAKSYAAQNDVADWKDLDPRMGVAYDLFGNGKTAIKASLSRGVITEGNTGIATLSNPVNLLISSTTRPWTDYSGTFDPATDGANFTSTLGSGNANGAFACVPSTGANCALGVAKTAGFYNQSNVGNISYAPDVTHGWQTRPDDWMLAVSVQREITNGIAVSVGYYRTWFGNLMVAQNSAIPATGYDQYCVNVPASPGYSAYGAKQICNLYDPQPQYAGLATYVVKKAADFNCAYTNNGPGCGNESDVYTGIDAIVNARYHNLVLQGGVTAGHEVTNYCVQVNSPQDLYWTSNPTPIASGIIEFPNNNFNTVNDAAPCSINPPWYQNLQFKIAAVYTVSWWKLKNFRVSANEQNLPSIPLQGTFTYGTSAVSFINPVAGHTSLVGCSSCKVEVVTPQTVFPYGRNNQFDFRVARDFLIKERLKIEPTVDLYNLFNASPILSNNTAYGSSTASATWQNVTGILPGRLVKFGIHVDF